MPVPVWDMLEKVSSFSDCFNADTIIVETVAFNFPYEG
jgi:hypothetical protein